MTIALQFRKQYNEGSTLYGRRRMLEKEEIVTHEHDTGGCGIVSVAATRP